MLEYLPFVPISQGVRIGVSILSYNGKVRFGVTGDYDTVPEVEWFCRRIEAGVAKLAELRGRGWQHCWVATPTPNQASQPAPPASLRRSSRGSPVKELVFHRSFVPVARR